MRDNKVILFSAGRTGSTFIWQILKEIFPNTEKAHQREMIDQFFDKKYDCVITVRNVVDSYLSRLRTVFCNGDEKIFLEKIKDKCFLFSDIVGYRDELFYVKNVFDNYEGRILILPYKKFYNNFDYVFERIEKFFDIKIAENEKKLIKNKCCLKNNIKIQKKLESFKEVDAETEIHGNHIWSSKDDYSRDLLSKENYKAVEDFLLNK